MYRPKSSFTTPFMLLVPTYRKELGKLIKEYPDDGDIINVSFKTFGGTETIINDVWSVQDTGEIETWYRPDIAADVRLKRMADGKMYEVLGDPENIEMRNQFMKFKVKSMRGSSHG